VDPRDPLPPEPTPAQIALRRARRRREEALRRARKRRKRALQTVCLAGLAALVVSVAGGGGPSAATVLGQVQKIAPRQHTPEFDWVEPFSGSPRSVADENKQSGTGAWRLHSARARGHISGYVAEESVRPGQTQRVYVDAPRSRWIRVEIYRMGWYGGRGGRLVLSSRKLKPRHQRACTHDAQTGLVECHWRPAISFVAPPGLTSGVYVVKLMSNTGAASNCLFVLEAATEAKPSHLLVQLSTATYEAYNSWGGNSLYPGGRLVAATGTDQGVEVSFDRPYKTRTGAGQLFSRDFAALQFVEREGYDASYTTGPSIDANPGQALGHKMLLDVGHSEYWSQRDADAFRRARDSGTNLAFLSSNTMVWRVRYEGHRMVGYKEHATSDPNKTEPTGLMPLAGAPITGTAWQACVTPRVAGSDRTTYHYYAWRPSASLQPDWLYKDTGFTPSSLVQGIVGYEPDRTSPSSPPGVQVVGSGNTLCQRHGPLLGVGQSTLYTARSGALVFSSGTLGWQLALTPMPDESPDVPRAPDARLVKLTENLFEKMGARG
jgi:hypothetical protein